MSASFTDAFFSIFMAEESQEALMNKAGAALRARDQSDPRWIELLDRLSERTGFTTFKCARLIQAIARGADIS